ncbi:NADH:flavorubredoxin reductase NorW [Dickeya fangzhongdai]|uniref:NADH:flavorubredoxin reductase NorW n=1 Tax=Dickeya fangzhongdai TaxID=1778540 RepID=A0A2K8QIK6_9GAMM|nr:NADH:flavorubredoxin reductase NorW [Dickeya fangzhongdai]ATZ93329.1 NADH:flavorubredoxin reductase NorW [Dickeya fangzhongdai]QOH46761.1 NADH:flavorubredoxin reductase NorW [Dickeya fangzhongdai]QOH51066.1 NADH:flavorubredoxin reductase NorW [Dickeya fangzhongdai]WOY01756.1 NADH:flavorubredoxin reductase NorW [Dickeya fangzhongdai]WOY02977.1 NADH:flavorubredoxin reductase NorW [Dickeya fangzhongdai]
MSDEIIVIGAGFAARQLIKNLRKQDAQRPIRLITADSGDEYNKPELSHVLSQHRRADDLTRMSAAQFAEEQRITLLAHTPVTGIDAGRRQVMCDTRRYDYHTLVLATGASAVIPPIPGHQWMLTLNSQQEYRRAEARLTQATRILILGAGLIGSELAMDMALAGKQITLVDRASHLLSALLPVEISARLQAALLQQGVELMLNTGLQQLEKTDAGLKVTLMSGRTLEVDEVISAIGLRANTSLAAAAGLAVNRGIVTDSQLRSSDPHIYALGDCAEINGKLLPFLQPIQLTASIAANSIIAASTGNSAVKHVPEGNGSLTLPAMLIKVKTPLFPLQLAGETQNPELVWHLVADHGGMVAKGVVGEQLRGFVVGGDRMKEAFPLLRQLSS